MSGTKTPVENGSAKAESVIVAICAILATLMIFTIQTEKAHEATEGHPGVLKLAAGLTAEIVSLTFQANENRRRLTLLEERLSVVDQADARLTEAVRGMETIPSMMARVATIEAEIKMLEQNRERRLGEIIREKQP